MVSGALVLLSFCWEKVWLSLLFLFLHSPSEIVPVSAGCFTASTRVAKWKGHRLGAGGLDFALKSCVILRPHLSSLVTVFVGPGLIRRPQAPRWTVADGCGQILWKVTLDSGGGETFGCSQALGVSCLLRVGSSRLTSLCLAHLPSLGILSEVLTLHLFLTA